MLTRKIRRVGSSLIISLPSQICEAFDISEGDIAEIVITESKIIITKVRK